jgi:hypothetical protein
MMQSDSSMLKNSASCVLPSLRGSTYGWGNASSERRWWVGEKKYDSPDVSLIRPNPARRDALFRGRPCWTVFLNILRGMPVPFEAGCLGVPLERSQGFSTTF